MVDMTKVDALLPGGPSPKEVVDRNLNRSSRISDKINNPFNLEQNLPEENFKEHWRSIIFSDIFGPENANGRLGAEINRLEHIALKNSDNLLGVFATDILAIRLSDVISIVAHQEMDPSLGSEENKSAFQQVANTLLGSLKRIASDAPVSTLYHCLDAAKVDYPGLLQVEHKMRWSGTIHPSKNEPKIAQAFEAEFSSILDSLGQRNEALKKLIESGREMSKRDISAKIYFPQT